MTLWHEFLSNPNNQRFVADWSAELDNALHYLSSDLDPDSTEISVAGNQEQWMVLADLNRNTTSDVSINNDTPNDYRYNVSASLSEQDIGNMPTWIKTRKESYGFTIS